MCFDVSMPPPRDYGAETSNILQKQIELAPDRFAAEQKFSPGYTDLALQNIETATPRLMSLYKSSVYPTLADISRTTTTTQRAGDIADVRTLGPQAAQAIRAANPQQTRLLDSLNRQALRPGTATASTSPIMRELQNQALSELKLGARLDPSLRSEVQQGIRSAQSARGFGYGANDAMEEIVAQGERGEQLRRARQGFAQSVEGQGFGEREANRNYIENARNANRSFSMNVANLNKANAVDPFLAVLARPSQTLTMGSQFGDQAMHTAGTAGPKLFNPESPYGSDVFNTNFNADAARRIAEANNTAAFASAAMSY